MSWAAEKLVNGLRVALSFGYLFAQLGLELAVESAINSGHTQEKGTL